MNQKLVHSGVLQMVRNALKHDADEGKKSRGEMLEELEAGTQHVEISHHKLTKALEAFIDDMDGRFGQIPEDCEAYHNATKLLNSVGTNTPCLVNSVSVSLERYSATEAMACIKSNSGIELYLAGGDGVNAKSACLDAAKVLREAAQRFELLAVEECPYADDVQVRINNVVAENSDLDASQDDPHLPAFHEALLAGYKGTFYEWHKEHFGTFWCTGVAASLNNKAGMSNQQFSAMRSKAGGLILRLLLASSSNKIGYEMLYRELSEAGLTNTVLEGEDRRKVLDYAEELGFSVNRVYPNPKVAGQVILTDKAKQKYL